MENEYLVHHGVKGMKWGVRRTPEQLGHPTAKQQYKQEMKALSESYKKANKNVRATRKELVSLGKDAGLSRKTRRQARRAIDARVASIYRENHIKYRTAGYEITKAYHKARVEELLQEYPEDSRKVRRAKRVADTTVVWIGNSEVRKDPKTGQYRITNWYVY